MYIIIVGGGRVGYYLTKALIDEGHEITIVEKNKLVCDTISDELGSICLQGDGCEAKTLAEVGTGRAAMFIVVTGDDEDNLVACQIAKHKFNVPHTIARVRNPQNEAIFKKLGVDVTVSSTNIILEHIVEEVPTHPLTHLLEIRDKGMEIVEVKIPPDAKTVGKPIKDLSLPVGSSLILISRKEQKPLMPKSSTVLEPEDRVIAVITPETEEELRTALRGT
ncbi:potassium channel family protein [Chloroflexota bacterium]